MHFVADISNIQVANTWNEHITDNNKIRYRVEINMKMVHYTHIHAPCTHANIENWTSQWCSTLLIQANYLLTRNHKKMPTPGMIPQHHQLNKLNYFNFMPFSPSLRDRGNFWHGCKHVAHIKIGCWCARAYKINISKYGMNKGERRCELRWNFH